MRMRRFSDLDSVILRSETPTQHMHVLATLVLDASEAAAFGYRVLQERVRERFHLVEPMRQRLRWVPFGPPVWVDDDDIVLEQHLHHVVLDGGGLEELAGVTARIASRPLRRDRPMWEVTYVEGLDDGRIGIIAKIHHCAVDGVSGIGALAAFFDLEPHPPQQGTDAWQPTRPPAVGDLGREVLGDLTRRPRAAGRSLTRVLRAGAEMTRSRSEDAPLPFTAPRLRCNGALTPRRSIAFTRLALDDIKELRRSFGVTVNDVIVGLLAGTLRSFLAEHDGVPRRPLVAAVPVSEREPQESPVGNRFSFMLYALPVHVEDPIERLLRAQRSAAAAKRLFDRAGSGLLENLATLAPPGAVGPTMRALSRLRAGRALPPLANVTASNIRGPDFPLYVSGARLEHIFPMGPLMEGVGLGLTVVSYRDDVDFGFIACPDLVPDVDRLAGHVHAELERLRAATAP